MKRSQEPDAAPPGLHDDLPPDLAEAWARVAERFLNQSFVIRNVIALVLTGVFLLFVFLEPARWKVVWMGLTVVAVWSFAAYDYYRRHVARNLPWIPELVAVTILLFLTSVVWITGGIESPVIMVFIPHSIILGMTFGSFRRSILFLSIPVAFTALFTAGGITGFLPSTTPAFLGLGDGHEGGPVYLLVKGAIVVILVTSGTLGGTRLRKTFVRSTRETFEARQQALEDLASRNREILSVSSTLAHELKNPLASIQGLAQIMAKAAPGGGKEAERLEVMRREIAMMGAILDGFRSFSLPLVGLTARPESLERIVRDVAGLNEGTAEMRGIGISIEAGRDVVVRCDRRKVRQALLNLLLNALDATPRGGRIRIRLEPLAEGGIVRIADTGPGLSPEARGHLFTPGFTTKEGGSGIGLVVARSIADQHGGSIALEDGDGGGCVAVMTLPAAPPPGKEEPS